MKLWTIYINNVEGCSGLKLLHSPTDEIKMYSIVDDPAAAPLDDLALSFAIYFAAISTLDDDEAQVTLGQDKQTLLLRSKIGLEQSFAHGDFLNSPTVTGLQALAIYLVSSLLVLVPLATADETKLCSLHFASTTAEKEYGSWTALRSG